MRSLSLDWFVMVAVVLAAAFAYKVGTAMQQAISLSLVPLVLR
jgi:hypothetical protein